MRSAIPLLLLFPVVTVAQPGKLLREGHETVTLEGAPVGAVHSFVRDTPTGRVHTQELRLSLKRGTAVVELRQEHGFEEDAEGRIVGLFLRQFQGTKLFLDIRGSVDPQSPERLEFKRDGKPAGWVRWSEQTWKPGDLDVAPGKPRWQPGDRATVQIYDPTYNAILRCEGVALEKEPLTIDGKRLSALVVRLTPEPLVGSNQRVVVPPVRWWLDDEGRVLRRELDMPGLGLLTLTRSDRAAPSGTAPVVNVLERGLVPLDRMCARPYATTASRLRLTLTDVPDAARAFISDEHQTVREVKPGVLDVVIHPVGEQVRREPAPEKEYLGSSRWFDLEDRAFQALVARFAAGPRDPWQRAQARANWVRQNLRPDNSAPFAPVSQIARELRGDCRHAALLTTALCRAEGLPARTAIGLVYIERNRKPFLGFHMWTEVYVEGTWRGLDGTPGIGAVGALHLKVNDASWHRETSLTPLQPALRLVGKMNAEALEIVE